MESTNSKARFYSRLNVKQCINERQTKSSVSCVTIIVDHVRHARERSNIIRYDKRFKPNRDAGFATTRRFSLSLQIQDKRIANPYQLQAELGLTEWAEVAVFRGFQPDEWIFGTEIGLLRKEPYLLSIGFMNWSPHLDVDPQPFIEAGY